MANCEQDISALTARRLLTYEKIPIDDEQKKINSEDVSDLVGDFRNKYVFNSWSPYTDILKLSIDSSLMVKRADKSDGYAMQS